MWKCHKCGKPVYFAERKQSLGYDWHPECLRCEECGKRLNPGQHAEHKGVPYCHVPCYGALFGPQLFGHGTRVESHTSFGNVENKSCTQNIPRSHLESKLKIYNQFYDGKSGEIRSREVNGRLVLEGALRIYWGVNAMIHLKEDVDQRTVVTVRKRNHYRRSGNVHNNESSVDNNNKKTPTRCVKPMVGEDSNHKENKLQSKSKFSTLPSKLDIDWDEVDDLLQVERCIKLGDKNYQTMPHIPLSSDAHANAYHESQNDEDVSSENEENRNSSHTGNSSTYHDRQNVGGDECNKLLNNSQKKLSRNSYEAEGSLTYHDGHQKSEAEKSDKSSNSSQMKHRGSTAIKRRNKIRSYDRNKLKRRCSINGHFYNRETSFFTPPYGSQMSVWVTSLVSTVEIINLILDKYKVDSKVDNFALFVVRDNGEQRRLADDEYPLLVRVTIGPHEDVAKLYLMDRQSTQEISFDVAQFLNLSMTECSAILRWYDCEEQHELDQINAKYQEMQRRMCQRMNELKVHL